MRLPSISALFESDFLEEVENAAANGAGNTTSSRQRHPEQHHNTGAELERMPFGKHKGRRFSELDDDYLDWILHHLADKPDIHAAARKVMESRIQASGEPGAAPAASEAVSEELPPVESYEDDGMPFNDDITF